MRRKGDFTLIEAQERIENRYSVVKCIAHGHGSDVYSGKDEILNRPVALKFVREASHDAYQSSLGAAARIAHPAFIGNFDAVEYNGQLVVVQEFIESPTFAEFVQNDLSFHEIITMGRSLSLAIAHAHRHGVIHGDITPSSLFRGQWNRSTLRINNVQLPPDPEYFTAVSHLLADSEQPQNNMIRSATEDIRAIGAILWLMLGKMPTLPDSLQGYPHDWELLRREVPIPLRNVIERVLLQQHPQKILSAEELIHELGVVQKILDEKRPIPIIPPWDKPAASSIQTLENPSEKIAKQAISRPISTPLRLKNSHPAPIALVGAVTIDAVDMESETISDPNHNDVQLDAGDLAEISVLPPAKAERQPFDIILWIAIAIGLFLFWLIVGYAIPGIGGH